MKAVIKLAVILVEAAEAKPSQLPQAACSPDHALHERAVGSSLWRRRIWSILTSGHLFIAQSKPVQEQTQKQDEDKNQEYIITYLFQPLQAEQMLEESIDEVT